MPAAKRAQKARSKGVIHLNTYLEFEDYLSGFITGHLQLLVVVAGHGLGKSQIIQRLMGDIDHCWIEGNLTGFAMYEKLYRNIDKHIVIDDVDSIYSDKVCVNLLKSLCQTNAVKKVSWNAQEKYLKGVGLPPLFTTTSPVLIITNNWRSLNRNVEAVEDRGHMLFFEPSVEEVHIKVKEWFRDEEIYDWFSQNLLRIEQPSFRDYVRAAQLKASGLNWKLPIGNVPKIKREQLALQLINDDSFKGNIERAREFERRGGGSQSTFWNYRRKLVEQDLERA